MRLLVTGAIHKTPSSRTTKNGDPMTYATIRADNTQPTTWVNVTAFGGNADTLSKLKDGDGVCISGKVEITLYQSEGKPPRPNICVTADQISSLKRQKAADSGKEKPEDMKQPESQTLIDAKKLITEKVREKVTTKPVPATGNCQQCGEQLNTDGLCPVCPF